MTNKSEKADPNASKCVHGIMTTAVIGPRGQIVIPKEARKWLAVKPGDQIVLMSKMPGAMIVIKADNIREMATHLLSKIK